MKENMFNVGDRVVSEYFGNGTVNIVDYSCGGFPLRVIFDNDLSTTRIYTAEGFYTSGKFNDEYRIHKMKNKLGLKVGDRVVSSTEGEGTVSRIDNHTSYPYYIKFDSGYIFSYDEEGYFHTKQHGEDYDRITKLESNELNTKSSLYRKYADMIEMCEGTDIHVYKCVKCNGGILSDTPMFNYPPETYTFAIGIIEGTPVFIGDTVYSKNSRSLNIVDEHTALDLCTLVKQKKMMKIGDKEVPAPLSIQEASKLSSSYQIYTAECPFVFENQYDANETLDAIVSMMDKGRDQ